MSYDYISGCNCFSCTEPRTGNTADSPVNEVNAQALLDIIPVLRELDAQGRFDMQQWANGVVNPNADTYTQCGTQFCLAGAKAVVDGWRPQYRTIEVYDPELHDWVQAEHVIATGRFVRPENRHVTDQESPLARKAADIAAEAFALDAGQTGFLFHGTWISRVTDLVRRIQWLVDGERWSAYPDALVELERFHGVEDSNRRGLAASKALRPAAAE